MKKLVLLLAVVVAFSFTALAQNQTNTTQTTTQTTTKTKKKSAAKTAKQNTIKGCLAAGKEPDTWTLTKGKRSYEVTGMDLSQHVGHEVKLSGTWENEKPAGEKTAGKELKVANVEHISDTCTTTTAAKAPKAKKSKKASPPGF